MTDTVHVDLERLLRPIAPERPGGDDLTLDPLYDEIREARRHDDPGLAAGVWARELKVADWPRVRALATGALVERSKDLQIASWLTEALTHLHGFGGARDGLVLLDGLLRQHWEHVYPENDGDLEPRANCLAWLNNQLARLLRAQPITSEGRSWYDYQNALEVDNAAERDRGAKAALLAEGKIDGDTWRKQVAATPSEDLAALHQDLVGCERAFAAFDAAVDETFGSEGPSLRELRSAIQEVARLVTGIAKERGLETAPVTVAPVATEEEMPTDGAATPYPIPDEPAPAPPLAAASVPGGRPQTRADALRQLEEIADFFRRTEPHSPVAYVIERAIKWANMPLDLWLQEVVKDPGVLTALNETLGVGPRE